MRAGKLPFNTGKVLHTHFGHLVKWDERQNPEDRRRNIERRSDLLGVDYRAKWQKFFEDGTNYKARKSTLSVRARK
jgi:hypothetical protein